MTDISRNIYFMGRAAGCTLSDSKRNKNIMTQLQMSHITVFIEKTEERGEDTSRG
jgi:hypothetical protein